MDQSKHSLRGAMVWREDQRQRGQGKVGISPVSRQGAGAVTGAEGLRGGGARTPWEVMVA